MFARRLAVSGVVVSGLFVIYGAFFFKKNFVDGTSARESATLGAGRSMLLDVLLL